MVDQSSPISQNGPDSLRVPGVSTAAPSSASGPPAAPPGPLRLSKPVGLAFTSQSHSRRMAARCCLIVGARARPAPVRRRRRCGEKRGGVTGGARRWSARATGVRPPSVGAAAPGAGGGSVACAHRPITPFWGIHLTGVN